MLILASASPRRSEILRNAGIKFRTVPAAAEENPADETRPDMYAVKSARSKCLDVTSRVAPEDTVLAADTVVYHGGEILGKPSSEEDAFRILKSLSGDTHEVYTGYAVSGGGRYTEGFAVTKVTFTSMTDDEIRAYIATGEPMDKAGAYGIQGRGSVFVSHIDGDYFNIMGLPVCKIRTVLLPFGCIV